MAKREICGAGQRFYGETIWTLFKILFLTEFKKMFRAVEESTSPMTYMKKQRDINEWYNFQEPNKYLFPDQKKLFVSWSL